MENNCEEIQHQFNRIKGQVNGIEKMINQKRDISEIIQQISSVRSALSRMATDLLKEESSKCFKQKTAKEKELKFESLVKSFFKIT